MVRRVEARIACSPDSALYMLVRQGGGGAGGRQAGRLKVITGALVSLLRDWAGFLLMMRLFPLGSGK